jgi:hypothetical protein
LNGPLNEIQAPGTMHLLKTSIWSMPGGTVHDDDVHFSTYNAQIKGIISGYSAKSRQVSNRNPALLHPPRS